MEDGTQLIGAIDIGGTKIAVGLVTSEGSIVSRRSLPTRDFLDASRALGAIETVLRQCMQETSASLIGIGIGCTGPIDPTTGVVGRVANLPGWEGCKLVDEIAARFAVTVAMENDADAAALAEATWGCGRGVDRFLYITLSTGIGGGFLLHGNLYRGANGSHPEMGHHSIDPSGPPCYCGAKGCWESLASGNALRDWFLDNDDRHRFTADTLDARNIFDLHIAGDLLAQKTVERLSYYVGIGLANLTTILVPDVIALGGGLTRRSDLFLDQAVVKFRSICGEVPAAQTEVRTATLRENLDLAGAASVWLQMRRSVIRKSIAGAASHQ